MISFCECLMRINHKDFWRPWMSWVVYPMNSFLIEAQNAMQVLHIPQPLVALQKILKYPSISFLQISKMKAKGRREKKSPRLYGKMMRSPSINNIANRLLWNALITSIHKRKKHDCFEHEKNYLCFKNTFVPAKSYRLGPIQRYFSLSVMTSP